MEIKYSERAVKQIKQIAARILKAIEEYALNPAGVFDIKLLKGK
jgi:hypothetical protein